MLGIFLTLALVAGLAFATSQVQKVTKLFSRADQSLAPTLMGVGNVTDSGFTAYWTTESETSGVIFFGTSPTLGDGVATDDRDTSNTNGKYGTHFVRVNALTPLKKYYFKIGSGTEKFGDSTKSDAPFEITTGNKLTATSVSEPIFGKVLNPDGSTAQGVIVVWEAAGAGKIVALSKTDGTFVLPITNARSDDLSQPFDQGSVSTETITLETNLTEKSTISCQPGLDRPLPTVKLGENLDCNQALNQKKAPSASGFGTASSSANLQVNLSDGETLPSTLPTISGKAGANQVVKIEVHSDTSYSGTVKADPSGSWSWTPPANLSPGQHTVTITVVNPDGTTQTLTRTFNVNAGEPILPITSGTPSANLKHFACANNRCTQVEGEGPDSCVTDGDCSQPQTPPATSSPVPPAPPVSGTVEQTWLFLAIGSLFLTAGLVLTRLRLLS